MKISKISLRVLTSAVLIVAIISIVVYGAILSNSLDTTNATTSSNSSTTTIPTDTSGFSTEDLVSTTSYVATTQTSDSKLGLELFVGTNATDVPSEDAIKISWSIINISPTQNNLTATDNWGFKGLLSDPCDTGSSQNKIYSPAGIAILRGYYETSNLSLASALPIWASIECPANAAVNISSYSFLPKNDEGHYSGYYISSENQQTMKGEFPFTATYSATVYASNRSGGMMPYNNLGSSLQSSYTLVAGDEWGDLVLTHFTVIPSNNFPTIGNFLSSPSSGGCTVNSIPTPCISHEFSSAIIFNCASQAATSSGCVDRLSSGMGNYTITVWYPYVNHANEPAGANCWYNEEGNPSPPYGYCFLTNSTTFVYSPI
ncbi:MAG: hypothetical protein ACREBS_02215 [Nitrososphaerales archaeon]